MKHFLQVEKRLNRNDNTADNNHKFMLEYKELKHMELIHNNSSNNVSDYNLPHHSMINKIKQYN